MMSRQVVFTKSATDSLKLVGETFPWTKQSMFRSGGRRVLHVHCQPALRLFPTCLCAFMHVDPRLSAVVVAFGMPIQARCHHAHTGTCVSTTTVCWESVSMH